MPPTDFPHHNKLTKFAIVINKAESILKGCLSDNRTTMGHIMKKLGSDAAKAMFAAILLTSPYPAAISARETAQQSTQKYKELTFPKTIHDFGTFSEASGPKTCTFRYKNETDIPIFIHTVSTSCGCTTTEWSGKPLKPGESGLIKVVFSNDLGAVIFDKSIKVYISSKVKPITLRIKGIVTRAE